MNIIIVGLGKVGVSLATQLRQEDHAITVIDLNQRRLETAVNTIDVQGIQGNGTSYSTLIDAGIQQADLFIAVTDSDEQNMLACLIARKAGSCQTIARIRTPAYYEDIRFIQEELGLAMTLNPEYLTAENIFRILQIPSALDVDTFAKGKVNMLRFRVAADSPLVGKDMIAVSATFGSRILVCVRERGGEVVIPSGATTLAAGDNISVIIPVGEVTQVLQRLGLQKKPIRSVTIAGGGRTSVYLAQMLLRVGIRVKILEVNPDRCEKLSDHLPKADIINADASSKQVLDEEGLEDMEALVCLTGIDEENIMLALYAGKTSNAKVVTKISRVTFEEIIDELPLGSVIHPQDLTAETIVQHVRALDNASGNNALTLYRLMDGRVEAMEFDVGEKDGVTGIPIRDLHLKKDILIASINRGGRIITPLGSDVIEVGDVIVVVTTRKGIHDLQDVVR